MSDTVIPLLILNGRPASGKSEVIAYLNSLSSEERRARYHLGKLYEIDDFPMLWTWFEEDALLEKVLNRPRLHTDADGYFIHNDLWHLLIERLSLEYTKLIRDNPALHDEYTALIEFSRGTEHGGYREAYPHLSDAILQQAGILYIDVPYEESLRKNRRRFNPDRPDSILEHGLPDGKLERLYKEVDWHELQTQNPTHIQIREFAVPYVVFENERDLTTNIGPEFEAQLEACLDTLLERLNGG
ncbi:MAG: hypothetical protein L0154_30070 [Chloroflexi bacterium]|nr:hypothetical protein [Chloroflexota bacterium]